MKEPIAIIGISCRFPGSNNLDDFWDSLVNGHDCIADPPTTRAHGLPEGIRGGLIDNAEAFDADFFGVNHDEAKLIDPQQRLLLEETWCALEDAGYNPTSLAGTNTCVFIGLAGEEYDHLVMDHDKNPSVKSHLGAHSSIAAGRLSQYFDFRGKSITINTACSSALIAIESACQELFLKQSELAVVGGVNLIFATYISERLHNSGWLSAQGVCRSLDTDADGYVRGEGVGVIVLKPYSQAKVDNDRIYALIANSCVKHNGRGNGLSLPSMQAQIDLLKQVYSSANPYAQDQTLVYIETNTVGAPLADAVELKALGTVIGKQRPANLPLHIGCLKPNIGHTEGASGIAGLIKVAMLLHKRVIPPTINFKSTVHGLSLHDIGLQVQTELKQIQPDIPVAMAGVSAFGFGGANAHLLLQEAIDHPGDSSKCLPLQIIILTARSSKALLEHAISLHDFLLRNRSISFANLCFTLNTKRHHFEHRLAIVATSISQLSERLQHYITYDERANADQQVFANYRGITKKRPLAAVFAGGNKLEPQAFQYMRDNYETFRRSISTCEEIVLARFGIDLSSVLNTQSSSSILTKEQQGFLSEYITFSIWETLGMEPTLCIGEGIGQLGAAVAAGLIDLNFAIDYLQNPATFSPPKTSHVAQRAYFSVWTNTFVHPGEVLDSSSWQLEQLQHDQAPRNCSFPPEIEAMLRIRLATGCLDNHSFCTNKHQLFNLSIEQLLLGLIQTSTADVSPHLELVGGYRNCTVVTLPPYPFERQTFTILGSRSSQPGCLDRRDTLNQGRSSSNQLSSDIEDQLCGIWTAMFGRSDFSPTDDFFLEGGDSCNVEQLRQDIHAAFGYPISAREIHSHPTIAAQVTLLRCAIQSGEIEFKAQSTLSRTDIISKPSSRLRYEEEITLEERSSFRNDREVSAALGFNREISSRIATLSALESQLHVMWAHVLGHSQFGITDNFFQVGGHSLAAAQLATAMESTISRRITTADLFCVPTIREQADWLRNPEPGLLRNLVTLQPGGDRPPIYGIHGWGGTIGHFVELGKTLGPCRSFFGLQANDNGGDFELQDQQDLLRNMAANYADQILERHVGGPIHLLGYSVGGWYAHAVADALLQRGAPIGLFAVLDTHPIPVIDRQLGLRLLRRKLKERVGSKREASINMFSQEDKLLLANRLRRLRRDLYLYMGIKLWLPTKVMATLKGHRLPHTKNDFFVDLLIRQYRPTKLPIKADVFAPSTELKFLGPLWASYCCGGARLNPLFDHHSDFINEKRAGELAEALELALARVENNL